MIETAAEPRSTLSKRSLRVFISFAPEDEAFFLALQKHLSGLKNEGSISTWAESELQPGEDREQRGLDELNRADVVLPLLSADYLSHERSQRELERALERASVGAVGVVPILVRPVDLRGTSVFGLPILPAGDVAVSQWDDKDAAWACVSGHLRTVVVHGARPAERSPSSIRVAFRNADLDPARRTGPAREASDALLRASGDDLRRAVRPGAELAPVHGTSVPDEAQLARLRSKVDRFWISGVLRCSLDATVMMPQPRTREDGRLAGLGSVLESAAPGLIPPDRQIQEIFEESGHSLLLLGDPGTGKTTQLLSLTRELLSRRAYPIPVVFTLATWQESAPSLCAWMIEELRTRYQVPSNLGERWLASGLVLPLFDGLDEVAERARGGCLNAINEALEKATLPGLAVTCRTGEYEALRGRLKLGLAVRQHRLSHDTVVSAFASSPTLSRLPDDARDQLLTLGESPLALSLLMHVASSAPPGTLDSDPGTDALRSLLGAYVEQMIVRSGKRRLPLDRERFVEAAEHLAWAMRRNGCTLFQLDSLQPGWLETPARLWTYVAASRLLAVALFSGSLVLSFGWTPLENQGFRATPAFGVTLAACTLLTAGSISCLSTARAMRRPAPKRTSWYRHVVHVGVLGLAAGAINAAWLGWWGRHPMAAVMGFEVGLAAIVLVFPHAGTGDRHADVRLRDALHFSWSHTLRTVPVGVALGATAFLGASGERDAYARSMAAAGVLVMTLLFGGLRGREVDDKATQSGGIGRSHRSAWVASIVGGALTVVLMGFHYGFSYGLCAALTSLVTLWLWYGGYTVIQHALIRALLALEGHEYCNERYLDAAIDRALLYRVGGGCMFIHPLFTAYLAERHRPGRGMA